MPLHWSYELDFALRSCISVSVVVFACLDPTIFAAVTHDGHHAIGVAFSAVASIFSFEHTVGGTVRNVLQILLGAVLGTGICSLTFLAYDDGPIPEIAIYPLLFCYTLLLNLLCLPLFSKKLSISLVALIFVERSFVSPTSLTCWWWTQDLVLGAACALLGTALPWPKMAAADFERKGKKCAAVAATLFHETIVAWLFLKVDLAPPVHANDDDGASRSSEVSWMGSGTRNRHWRRFFLVVATVRELRRRVRCTKGKAVVTLLRWQHRKDACSCFASFSVRTELRKCASMSLGFMQTRAAEACYGPRYVRAVHKYPIFISLIRELLLVQETAEGRLAILQELVAKGVGRDVFRSFLSKPDFRHALMQLAGSFRSCMMRLSRWLTHERGQHEELLLEAHGLMLRRLDEFDAAYQRGRMMVYYEEEKLERQPPVVLSMNCLIFALQRSVHILSAFCKTHVEPPLQQPREVVLSQPWVRVSLLWLSEALQFCHRPSRSEVVSSLVLASSITLAAVYGIKRSGQPFLAAFTIAYINGGTVTGVNVATSLLRAAGTAVAVLYTLIVVTLIATFKQEGSQFEDQLITAIATILFLIPSAYVRCTPYIGYSGRVAAFSAALLLLAPLTTTLVIERLIDTILGIAIFLAFEMVFAGSYTEALILDSLTECVASLAVSFLCCLETFRCADTASASASDSERLPSPASPPALPSRETLVYSRLEPSVFKSPHFDALLLEECVSRVEKCRQHLCFLHVVVRASRTLPRERMLPLQANLESIDVALVRTVEAILETLESERADIHRSAWAVLVAGPGSCGRWLKTSSLRPLRRRRTVDELTAELRQAGAGPGCESHDCIASLNDEEDKILFRFAELVADLRRTDDTSPGGAEDGGGGTPGARMTNAEVILVSAFLGCVQNTLEALKALKAQIDSTRNAKQVRLLRF